MNTEGRRRFSQQEFGPSQRKTVCSLHPLSPADLSHLSALAASTGLSGSDIKSASVSASGSLRSSPLGTPIPSPAPSPIPSRDPSPCNFYGRHHRDSGALPPLPSSPPEEVVDTPPCVFSLLQQSSSNISSSCVVHRSPDRKRSSLAYPKREFSPPQVSFKKSNSSGSHYKADSASISAGPGSDGDSLGLLSSSKNNVNYVENPDEDNCSIASTLGDGPGPPDNSSGNSNSMRLSPVIFTVQEPMDSGGQETRSYDDDEVSKKISLIFLALKLYGHLVS